MPLKQTNTLHSSFLRNITKGQDRPSHNEAHKWQGHIHRVFFISEFIIYLISAIETCRFLKLLSKVHLGVVKAQALKPGQNVMKWAKKECCKLQQAACMQSESKENGECVFATVGKRKVNCFNAK